MEEESEEDVGEHYELISDGQRYWAKDFLSSEMLRSPGHGQHLGESVMAQIRNVLVWVLSGKGQAETVQPVQSPTSA